MTCLVDGGPSYPLSTAVMERPARGKGCVRCGAPKRAGQGARLCRFCVPQAKPAGSVLCYACKSNTISGKGARFCSQECREFANGASRARKAAWERKKAKRCRGCRKVKPHGRGQVYCNHCRRARGEHAPRVCERCPNLSRSPQSKLCGECYGKAKAENAAYKRRWHVLHPDRSHGGGGDRQSSRMSRRLKLEREGAELVPEDAIVGGHGSRVDSAEFPSLPAAPLLARILNLIQRTALDSPWLIELPSARLTETGQKPIDQLARDGAPSARAAVCDRLGISTKRLWDWEHGDSNRASFDTADKVVTRAGWLWWEVWSADSDPVGHELARRAFEGE